MGTATNTVDFFGGNKIRGMDTCGSSFLAKRSPRVELRECLWKALLCKDGEEHGDDGDGMENQAATIPLEVIFFLLWQTSNPMNFVIASYD